MIFKCNALNANGPRVPHTSGALLLIDSSAHVEGSCTSHQKLRPAERLCGDCVSWTINPIRVARIPVFPLATLSLAGTHKSGSLHQVDPPSLSLSRREKKTQPGKSLALPDDLCRGKLGKTIVFILRHSRPVFIQRGRLQKLFNSLSALWKRNVEVCFLEGSPNWKMQACFRNSNILQLFQRGVNKSRLCVQCWLLLYQHHPCHPKPKPAASDQ